MAKRWEVSQEIGLLKRNFKGLDAVEFDMSAFLMNVVWAELDDVEQRCLINGLKQKVDDNLARTKETKLTEAEARLETDLIKERLFVAREWNVKGKEKAPTIKISVLEQSVVPMNEAGLDADQISKFLNIRLERVQEILDSVED